MFGAKFAAYWMTGVMALLAEALHTLSEIFISSILMGAVWLSARQADETHMFGYGRAQNVAAAMSFLSSASATMHCASDSRVFR